MNNFKFKLNTKSGVGKVSLTCNEPVRSQIIKFLDVEMEVMTGTSCVNSEGIKQNEFTVYEPLKIILIKAFLQQLAKHPEMTIKFNGTEIHKN